MSFKSLEAAKAAHAEGFKMGPVDGHLLQLGGTFVLYNGEIIFEQIDQFAGDHVEYSALLKVCGVPDSDATNLLDPQVCPNLGSSSSEEASKTKDNVGIPTICIYSTTRKGDSISGSRSRSSLSEKSQKIVKATPNNL